MTTKSNIIILMGAILGLHISISQAEIIDNSSTQVMTEERAKEYAHTFAAASVHWLSRPTFHLPKEVRRQLKTGTYTVILRLTMNEQGDVVSVQVIESSNNADLDAYALKEIRRAKLAPFAVDGKPVAGMVIIPINFVMLETVTDNAAHGVASE